MSYLPDTYQTPLLIESVDFLKRVATQANGVGTADANAGINDKDGTDYRGRSVRWSTGNDRTMQLCADGEEVHGTIDNISSGKMGVALIGFLNFRNGTAASLDRGKRIVGATRVVENGGTAQLGYIKTVDAPSGAGQTTLTEVKAAVYDPKGAVIAGGATPTANAEAAADVVVAFGMGG